MGRSGRGLSEAERTLWDFATRDIERPESPEHNGQAREDVVKPSEQATDQPKTTSAKAEGRLPAPSPKSNPSLPAIARIDPKLLRRLSREQQKIEATLDLHGLTAREARSRLSAFILDAQNSDKRSLLVITGKGRNSGIDEYNRPKAGVLRELVPQWLRQSPLSNRVHAVERAHERHGGSGAVYVILRRRRHKNESERSRHSG